MQSTYDAALERLLAHEGGYTNHPADPGGPTNFGITIYDYRKYVMPNATAADVRAMSLADAKRIYRSKYWDSQSLDLFEPGPDYCLFDYGVNSGIGRSGRVLRRVLGMRDDIYEITPDVIAAANERNAAELSSMICAERLRFLQSLKTWSVFGKGWGRRVSEVLAYSIQISRDLPITPSPTIAPAPGRGYDADDHARVRALQRILLGPPGNYTGAVDGDLGPKTIKAFQRYAGLSPDGVVGKITRPLLTKALSEVDVSMGHNQSED